MKVQILVDFCKVCFVNLLVDGKPITGNPVLILGKLYNEQGANLDDPEVIQSRGINYMISLTYGIINDIYRGLIIRDILLDYLENMKRSIKISECDGFVHLLSEGAQIEKYTLSNGKITQPSEALGNIFCYMYTNNLIQYKEYKNIYNPNSDYQRVANRIYNMFADAATMSGGISRFPGNYAIYKTFRHDPPNQELYSNMINAKTNLYINEQSITRKGEIYKSAKSHTQALKSAIGELELKIIKLNSELYSLSGSLLDVISEAALKADQLEKDSGQLKDLKAKLIKARKDEARKLKQYTNESIDRYELQKKYNESCKLIDANTPAESAAESAPVNV